MSAHTPGPPHMPWTMHSGGIPYIMCGRNGPSFGPVTLAGTQAEMMAIATVMHAAADLLAALITARDYVEFCLDDLRDDQSTFASRFPRRTDRVRYEDAVTIQYVERDLTAIDAAIAKATP